MSEIKKIKFDNGDEYEGEVKNSKMHGQGAKKYSNGEEEIGEFKEGKLFKGKVILIYSGLDNNRETQIEWNIVEWIEEPVGKLNSKKFWNEKEPILTNTMGNNEKLYVGEMLNGKRHGKGKLKEYIYEDSLAGSFFYSFYEGEWKEDKKNGYGIEKTYLISEYQGEWKENKYNGNGKYIEYWDGKEHGSAGKEICWIDNGLWENGKLIERKDE